MLISLANIPHFHNYYYVDDSFLQQSIPSATKHLFILAKIHLLFNFKLLNHSRSFSSSLNMCLLMAQGFGLTPPSYHSLQLCEAAHSPSLLLFQQSLSLRFHLYLQLDPSFQTFRYFPILKKLMKAYPHLPGTPRSILHTADNTHQFLHSLLLPQPLGVSSAPR